MLRPMIVMIVMLLTANSIFAAFPPPVTGKNGMVVSADKYATQVGTQILKEGGNAIDAAVAVGYALAVTHPCCGNIGGGGFMLIHLKNHQNRFLDFRESAPLHINQKMFLDKNGQLKQNIFDHNALMWGVPGTVKGLNIALKQYGRLSLRKVMMPAINLAEKGYRLTSQQIRLLNFLYKDKKQSKNLHSFLYKKGKPYHINELFKQPNLANTLNRIMLQGDAGFYKGKTAKAIVATSTQYGGVMTLADLTHYQVKWRTPITCQYRGYTIITTPPPGSGLTLCEILSILSHYPLNKWGFLSAKSIHFNIEAMRYAFYDRNHYLGDPDYTDIPAKWLLSPQHIKKLSALIKPDTAGNSKTFNSAMGVQEQQQTTHYSIVDKWGNAVAVTYSLNGYFGSHIIVKHAGFFMNNTMGDFTLKLGDQNVFGLLQGKQNLVAGGHRPLSSMSPTIVMKNNKLSFILGTPGGSTIITQIALAIENLIDYKMNIAQAIDECRYHMQGIPNKVSVEPFCFSPDTIKLLNKMGYKLNNHSTYFGEKYWGGMAGISIAQKIPHYYGAMDIRRPGGLAEGY